MDKQYPVEALSIHGSAYAAKLAKDKFNAREPRVKSEEKTCPECDYTFDSGNYCSNCGTRLEG